MLGSLVAVAVTATAIWLGPGTKAGQTDAAVRTAMPLRKALAAWESQRENERACPTISQLVEEDFLAGNAEAEDPWGNRYRIFCDPQPEVVSPGPDGRFETSDDVVLRTDE